MQDHISRVYDVFLSHVSKNRNIPIEEVEKIAGGRVWLGKQAKDLNLIDQLGGIDVAIDELTNLVKIGKPRLEIPRVKSKFIIPNPYDQVTIFQQLNEEISNLSGKNLLMSNIIIKFH